MPLTKETRHTILLPLHELLHLLRDCHNLLRRRVTLQNAIQQRAHARGHETLLTQDEQRLSDDPLIAEEESNAVRSHIANRRQLLRGYRTVRYDAQRAAQQGLHEMHVVRLHRVLHVLHHLAHNPAAVEEQVAVGRLCDHANKLGEHEEVVARKRLLRDQRRNAEERG